MDLLALMGTISDSFMAPLEAALAGVASVGLPILDAIMILVIGLSATYAAVGGHFPIGALIQSFLTLGIAKAAIEFWPEVISKTVDQAGVLGGLAGTDATSPFELVSAGAALSTLAFDHAGATIGIMSGWITGLLLFVSGVGIFLSYLVISALSILIWVEFWAAAVILSPLVALLPVAGFSNAGFVPLSFLISSTMRIVAVSLIAAYGSGMLADFALPGLDEPITWLHAFVALGLAIVMLALAWSANSLISGILMGRPGFAGGLGAMKTAIVSSAMGIAGGTGAAAAAASSGSAGGRGGSRSGGGGTGGGSVSSTNQPVNSRRI